MINNYSFLLAFEKIATLGTVHAAARELNLGQTAVTQRIKALEKELNLTLFLRSRRGMVLTNEGETLLQYVSALFELNAQFMSRFEGVERKQISLTILGPTSAIAGRIAINCEHLYKQFPFLRLNLFSEDQISRIDHIKRGLADLAIVPPELVPHEMNSKFLKPDRYLLVASSSWKRRKLCKIIESERIIDFDSNDQTTTNYLKKYNLLKAVRGDRLYINQNEALIRYIISGIGYGTLAEYIAGPYLISGQLITLNKGMALEEPLALAWYPRPNRADYFNEVLCSIK